MADNKKPSFLGFLRRGFSKSKPDLNTPGHLPTDRNRACDGTSNVKSPSGIITKRRDTNIDLPEGTHSKRRWSLSKRSRSQGSLSGRTDGTSLNSVSLNDRRQDSDVRNKGYNRRSVSSSRLDAKQDGDERAAENATRLSMYHRRRNGTSDAPKKVTSHCSTIDHNKNEAIGIRKLSVPSTKPPLNTPINSPQSGKLPGCDKVTSPAVTDEVTSSTRNDIHYQIEVQAPVCRGINSPRVLHADANGKGQTCSHNVTGMDNRTVALGRGHHTDGAGAVPNQIVKRNEDLTLSESNSSFSCTQTKKAVVNSSDSSITQESVSKTNDTNVTTHDKTMSVSSTTRCSEAEESSEPVTSSKCDGHVPGMVTQVLAVNPCRVKTSTVHHLASIRAVDHNVSTNSSSVNNFGDKFDSVETLVDNTEPTEEFSSEGTTINAKSVSDEKASTSTLKTIQQKNTKSLPEKSGYSLTNLSRDSGFDQMTSNAISSLHATVHDSTECSGSVDTSDVSKLSLNSSKHTKSTPGMFFGSLNSLPSSEESSDNSCDSFSDKVVVRKSRSYHDLRRQRSLRSSRKLRNRKSLPDVADSEWSESSLSTSADFRRHRLNSVIPPDSMLCGGGGIGEGVKRRRSWTKIDALPTWPENGNQGEKMDPAENFSKRRTRGSNRSLKRRSVAVMDNVEGHFAMTSTPRHKVVAKKERVPWSSLGDLPVSSKKQVSMAASAVYIPGVSLADKLRLAASKGHVDKIRELVSAGATFEPDREGRTALHYASLNGNADSVRVLILEGLDINSQDTLGYTALHRAAAQGHLDVIRVLVLEGCLIDRQDSVHGNAALHEAAWNGYSKTLEVLIRNKANIHIVNKAGFSALHLAAQNGHNQSARVLLYAGCNAHLKNNYGDTPLHTAARYGHAGVTRILISARCDINIQNKNGDSGLHISAALKRRKIAKLLVESGIKTSLKNKQNETAVDVAKRKDYPEIIFIITSQPKNPKKENKAKKAEKTKSSKTSGEEKKEKKGFLFWKNKSKDKDKEPQQKEVKAALTSTDPVITNPPPHKHHIASVPSEISSSDFNSHMSPEDLLRGFRDHVSTKQHQAFSQGSQNSKGTSTAVDGSDGRSRKDKRSIKGLHTDYDYKPGTQYYKDLAGNIREGPIGFTPVCKCGPSFKKMEKKMESDRSNLYDHIDASHRTLSQRIDHLDNRTAQQVFSLDKLMQERLDAEKRERAELIRQRCAAEQMELAKQNNTHSNKLKSEMKVWMNSRFSMLERRYDNHAGGCDGCYTEQTVGDYGYENNQPHYHRDDLLNNRFCHMTEEPPPPPGKLYRSKSDDTLSHTSSHHSRKHWKMKSTTSTKDVEGFHSSAADRESRRERRQRHRAKKEREAAQRQQRQKSTSLERPHRPSSFHEELRNGRSVEGRSQVEPSQYKETSPQNGAYNSLPRRKNADSEGDTLHSKALRHSQDILDKVPVNNGSKMQVMAQIHSYDHHRPDTLLQQAVPTTPTGGVANTKSINSYREVPVPPPPRLSGMTAVNAHVTSEISVKPPVNTQLHDSSASTFNSPDSATTQNSKTDSGSNPDSGYGSRIYNQMSKTSLPSTEPSQDHDSSVSFHSISSQGGVNSSQNTMNSSVNSPVYLTDLARYKAPNNTPQTAMDNKSASSVYASGLVNRWYGQKMRERSLERNLDDGNARSQKPAPVYLTQHTGNSNLNSQNRTNPYQATQSGRFTQSKYASHTDRQEDISKATEV